MPETEKALYGFFVKCLIFYQYIITMGIFIFLIAYIVCTTVLFVFFVLKRVVPFFTRSDLYDISNIVNEYFAVTDIARIQ